MKSVKNLLAFAVLFLCIVYMFALISGCGIVNKNDPVTTGLEISTRSPALNATGVPSTASISITFNHSINTAESNYMAITYEAAHTAGTPEGSPTFSWSGDNKTMTISGITGWINGPARVVSIKTNSTEAFKDYLGNKLTLGSTLWKYTLASGAGQYIINGTVTYASTRNILVFASTNKGTEGVIANAYAQTNSPYTLTVTNGAYYIFAISPTNETPTLLGTYGWGGSGGVEQATLDAQTVTVSGADVTGKDFVLANMYVPPTVTSRSPALNATGVSASATLTLEFSTAMDTRSSMEGMALADGTHTAGYPTGEARFTWSNGNRTLTLSGITNWQYPNGTVVHVITSGEGCRSAQGTPIAAGTDLLKYTLQTLTAPTVTNRSPSLNATNVAQTATLQVTFSTAINTLEVPPMPIKLPTDHTADDPYGATWAWSSGNTVLTITGVTSWSGGAGTVVHATASADAFKSAATGLAVAEDTDIWKYTLASAGPVTSPEITTRFPPLNQGNVTPDASAIGYVDFDKEMDVASFSSHDAFYINESSGHHSAGDPSGTMSIYWSNSNTRLNITGVSGWSGGGGTTVEICSSGESSWHSLDGGILTPGTILWRYRLSQGSGPSGPTPEVVSQIPTLDATGVSSTAAWIITFNTSIDTSSFGSNIIKAGTSPLHTAGWPTGTVTPVWSSGNTVLTLNGWTGWDGGGDQVHLVASFEGIRSYGGRYLPENSTIVRYQIASIPTPITPEVSSRTPTLEATGVASNETLIITFSTSMDTASTQNSITARNGTHTAGSHSGYTSNWSNNNQTLTITNLLWSGGGLTVVNLISSGEGVRSYAGIPMAANTDLWKYTLASQGGGSGPTPEVSSRSPLLDATGVSGSATLSVTFSTTMDTNSSEQSITVHPTLHTAGNPIPSSPSPVWSNGNRTITFSNITGWTGPGKDVYVITNGEGVRSSLGRPMPAGSVLWRYTLQ